MTTENILQILKLELPDFSYSNLEHLRDAIRENFNKVDPNLYPDWCGEDGPFDRINKNVEIARNNIRDSVVAVKVAMDNTAAIEKLSEKLIDLAEELENAESEEEAEGIEGKIEQIKQVGNGLVIDKTETLDEKSSVHKSDNGNITFYEFNNMLTDEEAELKGKITTLNEKIETVEAGITKTEEERESVGEALRILLTEENIFDLLGETIPTIDEIAALMELDNKQLALIALVLDLLSNLANIIGTIFKQQMFFDAQDALYDQIVELQGELGTLKENLNQAQLSATAVDLMITMDSDRFSFVEESNKLVSAYELTSGDILNSLENHNTYEQVLSNIAQMFSYAENIITDIES